MCRRRGERAREREGRGGRRKKITIIALRNIFADYLFAVLHGCFDDDYMCARVKKERAYQRRRPYLFINLNEIEHVCARARECACELEFTYENRLGNGR